MSADHADFYLDTGPHARWLGSLSEHGHPSALAALAPSVPAAATAGAFAAAVTALLADHRADEVGFAAAPARPGDRTGWPWLANDSGGWHAYTFVDGRVQASTRGGPWFAPEPALPDGGADSPTGLVAVLPVIGDTAPKKVTVTVKGFRFRGMPVPLTTTVPPMSPDYLARRGEVASVVATAVEEVVGRRWPLPDLARPAIREATHSLLRPGPAAGSRELPVDAPFAHERVVAALRFLCDADHFAEGNNPTYAVELLDSAVSVAGQAVTAHRTHQPYPWPHR
jgi:hypothetical protein